MLLASSAVIVLVSLGWALFFAWSGDWLIVASDVLLCLLALHRGRLARAGQLRRAALALLPVLLLVVLAHSLFLDLPTAAVPRTSHLYLLPMAIFSIVAFRHDAPRLRRGLPALLLLLFVLLSATQFGIPGAALPDSLRLPGSWITASTAIGALLVLLHLLQSDLSETSTQEIELRDGITHGQFELFYQPQHDGAGRLIGAEALVRWRHPQRGLVAPGEFIPLAERTGLILPLGQLVLEQACRQLAQWAGDPGRASWSLAVNVSPLQMQQSGFVASVLGLAEYHGVAAGRLKLELTESVLLQDFDQVQSKMHGLRAAGIAFALDDFGTGYSSLQYLRRLPLEQIKIDRSFVAELDRQDGDRAIVSSVIALGHSLGLQVIAEGVENAGQWRQLSALGCRLFQGYWFSAPLELAAFEAYAAAGRLPADWARPAPEALEPPAFAQASAG
jgi:EAL domain-containing protein (putative c-di-GMP-specific phosphodiesterase class I)